MQVVDIFRASVFNSSLSAFYLAVDNNKYMDFACKLLRAKNEHAYSQLIRQCSNPLQLLRTERSIEKYESLLYMLEYVYNKKTLSVETL